MDNKLKLQSLENELSATLKHAEDVINEYMETAIEQAVDEVLSEMNDFEKTVLLLDILEELQSSESNTESDPINNYISMYVDALNNIDEEPERDLMEEFERLLSSQKQETQKNADLQSFIKFLQSLD